LLTAAQNHCLEVLRRHPQVDKPTPDPIADSRGEADPEAAVVERALITAVLGELRVRERRALLLWAVERRPLAGIARELGLSYTAVQQLLFRARRHAASVAARVATALLGLSQLGRFFRWASHAGQMVLVATLVPVVLASMVSSTPHPDPPPQGGSAISSPTLPSPGGGGNLLGLTLPPNRGREKTMTVVEVSGVAVSVPSISVPGATSAINRAVKDLERSLGLPAPRVPTLPSPGAGGNLLP
jgi:hypothetical protein